ncbi:DUF2854 domain-containing protein [Fagus crenata]
MGLFMCVGFMDFLLVLTEDGKYCLVLVFEAKALQLSVFEKRQAKFASFFGPGITAEVSNYLIFNALL